MAEVVAADRLRAIVRNVENVNEQIDGLKTDLKELYAGAKSEGFDVKILRKVIARRRKGEEAVREEQEMLDLYEGAISGQMALPLDDNPSVSLTGPDGEVLFEGSSDEFRRAAAAREAERRRLKDTAA